MKLPSRGHIPGWHAHITSLPGFPLLLQAQSTLRAQDTELDRVDWGPDRGEMENLTPILRAFMITHSENSSSRSGIFSGHPQLEAGHTFIERCPFRSFESPVSGNHSLNRATHAGRWSMASMLENWTSVAVVRCVIRQHHNAP
jgi:hypothetical protein